MHYAVFKTSLRCRTTSKPVNFSGSEPEKFLVLWLFQNGVLRTSAATEACRCECVTVAPPHRLSPHRPRAAPPSPAGRHLLTHILVYYTPHACFQEEEEEPRVRVAILPPNVFTVGSSDVLRRTSVLSESIFCRPSQWENESGTTFDFGHDQIDSLRKEPLIKTSSSVHKNHDSIAQTC